MSLRIWPLVGSLGWPGAHKHIRISGLHKTNKQSWKETGIHLGGIKGRVKGEYNKKILFHSQRD